MGITRRLLTAIVLIVLIGTVGAPLCATGAESNAAAGEAPHDAEVESFWSTLDATWLARDAERFSQLFTEDASFGFVVRGRSLESRATILQHFTEQFARQASDLRHVTEVREIRIIAPGVVAVDGKVEVLREGSGESAEAAVLRRFAIFAVMLKAADEWKIRLVRAYQLPAVTPVSGKDSRTGLHGLLRPAVIAGWDIPGGFLKSDKYTSAEVYLSKYSPAVSTSSSVMSSADNPISRFMNPERRVSTGTCRNWQGL